jgi:SNF2 family DNA or RNA helicase
VAYAEICHPVDGVPYIEVTTSWNEKELIKEIPGSRWNVDGRTWTVPLGWAQCVILKGVFAHDITFGDELTKWGWTELEQRVTPALGLRLRTELPPEYADHAVGLDPRMYDFQTTGSVFIDVAGDVLLGDEMGTGKTIQALAALSMREDCLPALVICPNSTKYNWERETRDWLPTAEPITVSGSAAEKQRALKRAIGLPNAVVIVNIESVRSFSRMAGYGSIRLKRCRECDKSHGDPNLKASACEVHEKELNRLPFKTVIVDEAHRIKDPHAKQTRACWAVGHQKSVLRRWALTGTPLANHPGDLWSLLHFIAPYEHPTKSRFVDRYCLSAWNAYGGLDIVGVNPTHKKEFFAILDPRFRRMPKALVLPQLPDKVRQWRHVDMTPKQAKAYRELESSLITRLDTGELLVAPNNLAAQTRLLQLSSSYCTLEPDPTSTFGTHVILCEPCPKVDALVEIADDLGDRPFVACAQSKQLIMLAARRFDKLKIPYGLITGDQSEYERDLALRRATAGELRAILFTVQAGGTGLTMTFADTIVFLQRSWSMIANVQSEDRVHRIGSEIHESINVIDVLTRGTVEERQLVRLYDKFTRLEEINRDKVTLLAHGKGIESLVAEEERIMNTYLGLL